MADSNKIIKQIIKRHGDVINLKQSPQTIIDIIRTFGPILEDDGGLPGGVPPPPPPGPSSFQISVTLDEVMREILKLSRSVTQIRQQLGAKK